MNGAITPIRPIPRRARVTASLFGTKPRSSIAASTRSSVEALTRLGALSASDTVEMLTPAMVATS